MCFAPDSSLPELPPEDTTPLNQQRIGKLIELFGGTEDANKNKNDNSDVYYMESEEWKTSIWLIILFV